MPPDINTDVSDSGVSSIVSQVTESTQGGDTASHADGIVLVQRAPVVRNDNIRVAASDKYKTVIDKFVSVGTYINSDNTILFEIAWMPVPRTVGFGEFCLDLVQHKEITFSFPCHGMVPRAPSFVLLVTGSLWVPFGHHLLCQRISTKSQFCFAILSTKMGEQVTNNKGIFLFHDGDGERVFGSKLSRKIFMPIKSSINDDTETGGDWSWSIREAADHYNQNLQKTLRPTAFPAKDKDGNEILPAAVEVMLSNAVVAVTFKINHYMIGKRPVVTLDVESLTVLED